jgi:hypothetical protein
MRKISIAITGKVAPHSLLILIHVWGLQDYYINSACRLHAPTLSMIILPALSIFNIYKVGEKYESDN